MKLSFLEKVRSYYFELGLLIGLLIFVATLFLVWKIATHTTEIKPATLVNTNSEQPKPVTSTYISDPSMRNCADIPVKPPARISKVKNELKYFDGKEQATLVKLANNFEISEFAVSPDGQKILYLYYDLDDKRFYGFHIPPIGLNIYDLDTKKNTKIIPLNKLSIAYPSWSADGKYFSVWIGEGKIAAVYDASDFTKAYEIKSTDSQDDSIFYSQAPVSPIWFVPGDENKIAYVESGDLVEAEIVGFEKNTIVEKVKTIFDAFEGPLYAIAPIYSKDANFIAILNKDVDLVVFNRQTNKAKIVAPHSVMDNYAGQPENFFDGEMVGFNEDGNFVFNVESSPYIVDKPRSYFVYDTKLDKVLDYEMK